MSKKYYIEAENNASLIFKKDVKDKKSVAHSARKKVTHSGCNLPTRNKAELQDLNGDVFTYNLHEPWTWEQFTQPSISPDIQKMYLGKLTERFGISCSKLDALFCDQDITVIAEYLHARQLAFVMTQAMSKRDHRYSEEDAKQWKLFCAGEPTTYGLNQEEAEAFALASRKTKEVTEMKAYFDERSMPEREGASFVGESRAVMRMVMDMSASAPLVHRVYLKFLDQKARVDQEEAEAKEAQEETESPAPAPTVNVLAETAKMLKAYREEHRDEKGNPLSQRKLGQILGQSQSIICGAENMNVSLKKATIIMQTLKEIIAEGIQPKQIVFAAQSNAEAPAAQPLPKGEEKPQESEAITEPVCVNADIAEPEMTNTPAPAGRLTLSGNAATVVSAIKKIYGPNADDLEVRVFATENVQDVLTLRSTIAAVACAIELIYEGENITLEIAVAA